MSWLDKIADFFMNVTTIAFCLFCLLLCAGGGWLAWQVLKTF